MKKNQDELLTEITQLLNETAYLSREEYRTLLDEIIIDCQDRIDALDEDDEE